MVFVFGKPIYPVKDGRDLTTKELCEALANELGEATNFAENKVLGITERK
jgi:hypothetical protein